MKIIDKRHEKWQLGDVLVDNENHVGLIVKNYDGEYCLMDIDPATEGNYSIMENNCYGYSREDLTDFYNDRYHNWHKVNAKLVIE